MDGGIKETSLQPKSALFMSLLKAMLTYLNRAYKTHFFKLNFLTIVMLIKNGIVSYFKASSFALTFSLVTN